MPQFYLQHFTDPTTPVGQEPYVWFFQDDKWKKKSPEKIAYKRNFYAFENEFGNIDHRFEHALQKLESLIAPVLMKISKSPPGSLSGAERMYLSWFVISLQHRVPDYLNARAKEYEQLIRMHYKLQFKALEKNSKLFEHFKNELGFDDLKLEDVTPEDFENWKIIPKKAFLISQLMKTWESMAKVIFSMNWTMCYSEQPSFVTSESPVVTMIPRADGDGWTYGPLNHINVDLSVPLTSKLALFCDWRGTEKYRLVKVSQKDIRTTNLRTINSAADALSENASPIEIIAASKNFPMSDVVEEVSQKRKNAKLQELVPDIDLDVQPKS